MCNSLVLTLQAQLVQKDLPLFEQIIGHKINYTVAKGCSNYLCLDKLAQQSDEADFFDDPTHISEIKRQVNANSWNGDRETLTTHISNQQWHPLTSNNLECSGSQCLSFEDCFFFKARQKAHTADIIVTNHNLLLADLSLGGGVLLPDFENSIYIFDECHHLPQRAISHFEKATPLVAFLETLDQLNASSKRAISGKLIKADWEQQISPLIQELIDYVKQLKSQLDINQSAFDDGLWHILDRHLEKLAIVNNIAEKTDKLASAVDRIHSETENSIQQHSQDNEKKLALKKHLNQLRFYIAAIENFSSLWHDFLKIPAEKEAPIARWFEKITENRGREDYICHCSPISASQILKNSLWQKIVNGAILCSATVRSLGNFNYFLKKTGLNQIENVNTHTIAPIFNYQNSLIFAPQMNHDPASNAIAHGKEALNLLEKLILPYSGTLVLFNSRKAMHEAQQQLEKTFANDILMQGQASKSSLISQHCEKIDANKRSILFGLSSFAEGVDLPDRYCQHVIIHKLPFAVPSTPVELTRSAWLQKHQLNAFFLLTLPETATKLTQCAGRLIRHEQDKGMVSILDRRIYSKAYGKQLLDSLPPFSRLISVNVDEFRQNKLTQSFFTKE